MARNGRRLGFLPGWRKRTYLILTFNLFMLAWVIGAASSGSSASGEATNCGSLTQGDCTAPGVGTSIAMMLLVPLWAMGELIWGAAWLATNAKKGRDCPSGGQTVKKGLAARSPGGPDVRTPGCHLLAHPPSPVGSGESR